MSKRVVHITPDLLRIDPRIQRPLDKVRVTKLVKNFDPASLGALETSLRDNGERVILDGQHRHAAALTVGYEGKITCIEHDSLTLAEEAALFITLNDAKKVNPLVKYQTRVVAQDPVAVGVDKILAEYGWEAKASKRDFKICAIQHLENLYCLPQGPVIAKNTMHVITFAWAGRADSTTAAIITGIGLMIARYGNLLNYEKLIKELSKIRPVDILGSVRLERNGRQLTNGDAAAIVITRLYNKGLRSSRVPEWQPA